MICHKNHIEKLFLQCEFWYAFPNCASIWISVDNNHIWKLHRLFEFSIGLQILKSSWFQPFYRARILDKLMLVQPSLRLCFSESFLLKITQPMRNLSYCWQWFNMNWLWSLPFFKVRFLGLQAKKITNVPNIIPASYYPYLHKQWNTLITNMMPNIRNF